MIQSKGAGDGRLGRTDRPVRLDRSAFGTPGVGPSGPHQTAHSGPSRLRKPRHGPFMSPTVQCVRPGLDSLGEGPFWDADAGRLYWFDIRERRLQWYAPAGAQSDRIDLPLTASAGAPMTSGGLLLATSQGLARCDPVSGQVTLRWAVESE